MYELRTGVNGFCKSERRLAQNVAQTGSLIAFDPVILLR